MRRIPLMVLTLAALMTTIQIARLFIEFCGRLESMTGLAPGSHVD